MRKNASDTINRHNVYNDQPVFFYLTFLVEQASSLRTAVFDANIAPTVHRCGLLSYLECERIVQVRHVANDY